MGNCKALEVKEKIKTSPALSIVFQTLQNNLEENPLPYNFTKYSYTLNFECAQQSAVTIVTRVQHIDIKVHSFRITRKKFMFIKIFIMIR